MSKTQKIISWVAAVIGALIMLQTLYFKFTGAPKSIYIFTTIGLEPWGRIGIGVGELIASILLLIPVTRWFGSLMTIGLMSGAVFFHLCLLGIDVMNDGGQLFYYALAVLATSTLTLFLDREKLFTTIKRILGKVKK